jgi:hypothetical protein
MPKAKVLFKKLPVADYANLSGKRLKYAGRCYYSYTILILHHRTVPEDVMIISPSNSRRNLEAVAILDESAIQEIDYLLEMG